jgi:predicted outer membrane repeat protein
VSGDSPFLFIGDLTVGGIWNTGTLQIENSRITDSAGDVTGGIVNEGILRIHNTVIADNLGTNWSGGVLNHATLEMTNTSLLRNQVNDGAAGAIANLGTLSVKRTLFAENQGGVLGGGFAGGIFNFPDGTLEVTQSSFARNESIFGAGGIENEGELTVKSSLFFGNSGNRGGGISTTGPLTIENSVITANTATSGGGIFVEPPGTLTRKNTIVTGNTPDDIFPVQ